MEHHDTPFLQTALLCEGVTTDSNGRHTIYNEFSQYTMGYSQPFTLLTIWRGSDEHKAQKEYKEKTEIIAPDGRIVASGENGPFTLNDSTFRQVNSILLEDVDFTHDGIYDVRVALYDDQNLLVSNQEFPITVV